MANYDPNQYAIGWSLRRVYLVLLLVQIVTADIGLAGEFFGKVVDADTGRAIAARVYVRDAKGRWLFVKSADPKGSALPYREQWVPMPLSVERHTTISAHPFRIELSRGKYEFTILRGKEYFPLSATVTIDDREKQSKTFRLKRWVNMAERGWYSGETHVHRRIQELPNVMLAEDLNVAFPVTYWTIKAFASPDLSPSPLRRQGPSPFGPRQDRGHQPISVDPTHVIFPRNTEYEVFTVGGKRHVLGAVFILNHKTVFREGMPPVAKLAEQAHREGALLDLDKHSWPWSMMLVPIAKVDLYELSNNSVWRTRFGFRRSSVQPPKYMKVETDKQGMTELGWLHFGFENYYTLLNCGFRIQPTAGTASGVHPVPLGFSRVYVHVPKSFSTKQWLDGLRHGRSFVTTGPMLFAKLDGQHSGHVFHQEQGKGKSFRLQIDCQSPSKIERIEVLVNGQVQRTIKGASKNAQSRTKAGAFRIQSDISVPIKESSWLAVRCFQRTAEGRVRFAHTAPWHVVVGKQPIRPRTVEVQFLIRRIRDEIARNKDLLPAKAMKEYYQALEIYQRILKRAK